MYENIKAVSLRLFNEFRKIISQCQGLTSCSIFAKLTLKDFSQENVNKCETPCKLNDILAIGLRYGIGMSLA